MRQYVVQPGDTPARIAIEYAGCPKCAVDLIRANPHKTAVKYPNGFVTFKSLKVNESLNLPTKWFNGDLESRPPAYFRALPYPDGVTPSALGDAAHGILGDYSSFDSAATALESLPLLNNAEFAAAVDTATVFVDSAVKEALGSANATAAGYAKDAQAGAYWARQRAMEMAAAVEAGDTSSSSSARSDIQNVLTAAIGSARSALQALYGASGVPGAVPASAGFEIPVPITPLPAAVQSLLAIDPCVPSSAAAVCAAQAAMGLPVDGKYGEGTSAAVRGLFSGAPAGCAPRPSWWAASGQTNCPGASKAPSPQPAPPTPEVIPAVKPPEDVPLNTAAIVGASLLGAAAVGTAIYLAVTSPKHNEYRL